MKLNKLTKEEERVIVHKGTEMPFTGEYDQNFKPGTYVCRRCEAPLYRSDDKFDAHCGWPAFDKEIPGAIKHVPPDMLHKSLGAADELQCARCGAYLGHQFVGEGFTQTNTRACVNSISMKFIPKKEGKDGK
ncbi:MAG: peptide-methionine (R)-S-oxide reductase [Candidatus Micrarchaeota archaeon]|nr:peptide-methionine (R)-S-oxide reductase [Candidatus Micrarchaeota archaeon]